MSTQGLLAAAAVIVGVVVLSDNDAGAPPAADGPVIIRVENHAPGRWPVAGAVAMWNARLHAVRLQIGLCLPDVECVKVREVPDATDPDLIGVTSTPLFGLGPTEIDLVATQVGLGAEARTWTIRHEFGHALGLDHRSKPTDLMAPEWSPGVMAAVPDHEEITEVDSRYARSSGGTR